jgi:hypothetical protein
LNFNCSLFDEIIEKWLYLNLSLGQNDNNSVKSQLLKLLWGMCIIPIFLPLTLTYAQDNTPKYSNEFLAIGVGARALGMSNAMTSVVDDVTAGYWNPAALTDIEFKYQFAAQHASYFAGVANYDYLSAAMAIDEGSHMALSLIRFAVDDIPDTRLLFDSNGRINYDNIDFFSANDIALTFSYARAITFASGDPFATGLTFGVNTKLIWRNVGDFAKAFGFGLDISAKYRYHAWDFGIMLRDITGTFNAWTIEQGQLQQVFNQTNNQIPSNSLEITLPRMVLGASRSFKLTDKIGMLTAADLHFTFDGRRNVLVRSKVASIDPQIGLEFDYEGKFFFRTGFGNFQRIKELEELNSVYWTFQPNVGLGIVLDDFTIDYALTDIGNVAESPYSHVFSIKMNLKPLRGSYARNKRKLKDEEK